MVEGSTPSCSTMKLDKYQLAWAAGFFDGEGWTGCVKNGGKRIVRMTVTQNNSIAEVFRFYSAVGWLGYIDEPRITAQGSTRYDWETGKFEHAQAVIAMLWRYLCGRKRKQAAIAFEEYKKYQASLV